MAPERHALLQACGLPGAWAGQAAWTILETGFGAGLNFLAAWQAWQDDPQRPALLHYVAVETAPVTPQQLPAGLAAQWWGLLPGLHRMVFEGGRVLLTLCVGEAKAMLRELDFAADSVFLAAGEPGALAGVARLCRRGTRVAGEDASGAARRELAQCGFQVRKAAGTPALQGVYDPAWEPRNLRATAPAQRGRCVVIGGGIAGAAAAASLARRGWAVEVLDAADHPAAGASALPVGLAAPHTSPDDNLLSRLSRAGIRASLQQARLLGLRAGEDWQSSGALELQPEAARALPLQETQAGTVWQRPASPQQASAARLAGGAQAIWHEQAAWIKPVALVRGWLAQPGVRWRGETPVARLEAKGPGWQLWGPGEADLGQADLVVVAAAHASAGLLGGRVKLYAVRGQVSWGWAEPDLALPPFPVNGNGHFVPGVPWRGRPAWFTGSSFVRGDMDTQPRAAEHQANLARLGQLLPAVAAGLAPSFAEAAAQAWVGVRCTSTDRRPLAGLLAPGLAVSTAMGSRGLTFAALCAELLAARLHGEPLPLERKLAAALDVARQLD